MTWQASTQLTGNSNEPSLRQPYQVGYIFIPTHPISKRCIFCITNGEDVYNPKKYPFSMLAQFDHASHFALVSHQTLVKMGNATEDPDSNITFLNMTGRCGSTLIAQVNADVPFTVYP